MISSHNSGALSDKGVTAAITVAVVTHSSDMPTSSIPPRSSSEQGVALCV